MSRILLRGKQSRRIRRIYAEMYSHGGKLLYSREYVSIRSIINQLEGM